MLHVLSVNSLCGNSFALSHVYNICFMYCNLNTLHIYGLPSWLLLLHAKRCSIEISCLGRHGAFWLVNRAYLPMFTGSFCHNVQDSRTTLLGLLEPWRSRLPIVPEKSTTIYHVYGVIFLKTLLLIRICQNFKLPNAKFLIPHGTGPWNSRFLRYRHNRMHHHIDWKKNSCRKVYLETWITYWTYP
jgi:hypothetical protein